MKQNPQLQAAGMTSPWSLYKVLKHEGNQLTISVYNKKAVNTYP